MGSILYREGTGTVENGIECESIVVEIDQLQQMLASGWSIYPPGYEPPSQEEGLDEEVLENSAEPEPEPEPDVDEDPAMIRLAAKEAGIDGWETKRISTLKKALEAQ